MKQTLLNDKIRPACVYCAVGKLSCDGACVLCTKKGVMKPDSKCRSFRYDPLKRVPQQKADLPAYSEEEFRLE